MRKLLNLGAGSIPLDGWDNLDIIPLPGIGIVHDLDVHPWPVREEAYDEIQALDILEHVDKPVLFITACWLALKPGGFLFIRTPRYDAEFLWIDPSHKRGFHERSMDFFDPSTEFGRATGFYSNAKFKVAATVTENKNLEFVMVKI